MAHPLIDRAFYEAIVNFDHSEEAQDYYYKIMNSNTGKTSESGKPETVRDLLLRVYAALFCEYIDTNSGKTAGPEDVAATADLLHIGTMGYEPEHWYRMQHRFPIIDEDNYDRFAALVIADMNAGPLREAALNGGDVLLVGERDPFRMTPEERINQKGREVGLF